MGCVVSLCPWRDAHQYSNLVWHSNDNWLILTGLKGSKKTFPTPPACTVDSKVGSTWRCCCQILTQPSVLLRNRDSSDQTVFPVFNCPVVVSLCPLQRQLSVLGWQKWNPRWFPTVVHQQSVSEYYKSNSIADICTCFLLSSSEGIHPPVGHSSQTNLGLSKSLLNNYRYESKYMFDLCDFRA